MKIAFRPQEGFYKEVFLNLFLVFITFGLYLPWGVTNIRRLVWSNIYLDRQRFYYLGQAMEIVKGYLVLIGVYLISRTFTIMGEKFADDKILSIALSIPASVIFFALLYKAQMGSFRYQSQRTAFKGIRFRAELPGVGKQYLLSLKMGLFTVLTLGLLFGYYYFKIEKMKYNSLRFGEEKFTFDLSFRTYAWTYFKHMGLFMLAGIIISVGGAFITRSGVVIPKEYYFLLIPIALILAMAIFLHLLYSIFHLKIKHLESDNLTFSSDLTFGHFFKSNLLNIPILVFTLGVGFPIVIARNIGLYANSVNVHGIEELQTVYLQREGEGGLDEIISQSFDLDVLDVF